MHGDGLDLSWLETTHFSVLGRDFTVTSLAAFALTVLAGFLVSRILQSDRFRAICRKIGLGPRLVDVGTTLLSLLVFIGSVFVGLGFAGVPVDWTKEIPGLRLSGEQIVRLIILIVLVFWLSGRAKNLLYSRFLKRSGMDRALQYAISQVVGYVVLIAGIVLVFQNNSSWNLSTLAVFAGALGVGLGLGLQNIASNFISGLVILAERPIKIGDRVEVGELAGMVTEIHARSTTIVTNDNISIIVPNSRFIEDTVTNWSHGDPKVRFRIPVGVAYGSDVALVKSTLIEAGKQHPSTLPKPEPTVFFDSFGDSSLNFELVVWSDEMSYRPLRYKSDLNFAIERGLRKAGVTIPFPQRDVHFYPHPAPPSPEKQETGSPIRS